MIPTHRATRSKLTNYNRQTGFDPEPVPLVEVVRIAIMNKYTFVTTQETDEILHHKDGVHAPVG